MLYVSLGICYQRYSTTGINSNKTRHTLSNGSHEVSQPILTLTPQNYHQIHFITYTFSDTPHFLHRNPWLCDIPPTRLEILSPGTEKELTCLVTVISRPTNDHRWFLSSTTIDWMGSQLQNIEESKPLLLAECQFVGTKPSVSCGEASWSVLVFSV